MYMYICMSPATNVKFSLRKEFQNSNFRTSPIVQATPPRRSIRPSVPVMARASFTIDAMIRGYHICKDIWSAVLDEELPC